MESQLQILDHWVSIITGIFTITLTLIATWLAFKTYHLTKSDKEKTIAINELKAQTKKLEEMYLLQIEPKFIYRKKGSDYAAILNVGGDCYNLTIEKSNGGALNPRSKLYAIPECFLSHFEVTINFHQDLHDDYVFSFEDKLGNKKKQHLYHISKTFSLVESI